MKGRGLNTNAYGYSDPTAYQAIISADRLDNDKVDKVLEDIFKICKEHGVFIYGDIAFVDRKSRCKSRRHLYYNDFISWENSKKKI